MIVLLCEGFASLRRVASMSLSLSLSLFLLCFFFLSLSLSLSCTHTHTRLRSLFTTCGFNLPYLPAAGCIWSGCWLNICCLVGLRLLEVGIDSRTQGSRRCLKRRRRRRAVAEGTPKGLRFMSLPECCGWVFKGRWHMPRCIDMSSKCSSAHEFRLLIAL